MEYFKDKVEKTDVKILVEGRDITSNSIDTKLKDLVKK
jgi:hypothetical protein